MGRVIDAAEAAAAFEAACRAELAALKAGNVHAFGEAHGMTVADFERAARAAAPEIARPDLTLGARIEAAVDASFAATGMNTNLGIVLLAAPLLAAAMTPAKGSLKARLGWILDRLTIADAEAAFRAIATANPGGLGKVREHDVHERPRVTLLEAMKAAADRDRVARQYATCYLDVIGIGMKRLKAMPGGGEAATEAVHLAFLRSFRDTHVVRKFGEVIAEVVRIEAGAVDDAIDWSAPADRRHAVLAPFDARLKASGINPGTSADLTVATLLYARLDAMVGAE